MNDFDAWWDAVVEIAEEEDCLDLFSDEQEDYLEVFESGVTPEEFIEMLLSGGK